MQCHIVCFIETFHRTPCMHNCIDTKMRWTAREVERRLLTHLHDKNSRWKLLEIHAHFLRHGLEQSNTLLSHFISVCCRLHGKMQHSELVFQQAHFPDLLLFNAMTKGYSIHGPFDRAVAMFSVMKNGGVKPNEYTFVPLVKACCGVGEVRVGGCVHGEVLRRGLERKSGVGVGIVEFYVRFGRMEDARKVFDEMPKRGVNVVVWNLMVRGYCEVGDVDMGMCLFRRMRERSVVSWNSMMSSLAKGSRDREALEIFHEMQIDGVYEPDEATVVTVLPVCARLGAIDVGKKLHSYARSSGLFRDFVTVGNSILSFYCKCGDLETAHRVFHEMPRKNVVSWNTLISGLALNGEGGLGVSVFEEMINRGNIRPNESTFVGVLTCCVHAGLLEKGRKWFSSMTVEHNIVPKLEHYGCMVDLLGRSGCVREAYELIKTMPMEPSAALWGALLSGARTFGDVRVAECAVKELIELEPWNSGNYVLLSNIYAEEGRWDEVDKLRVVMKERSVLKSMGQSAVG